jgi:hypothetical protein
VRNHTSHMCYDGRGLSLFGWLYGVPHFTSHVACYFNAWTLFAT